MKVVINIITNTIDRFVNSNRFVRYTSSPKVSPFVPYSDIPADSLLNTDYTPILNTNGGILVNT